MAGVYVGSSAERWRGEDRDFVGTRGERGGGRGGGRGGFTPLSQDC